MLLTIDQIKEYQKLGYQVLDVRDPIDFAISHIPLSLSLPLSDSFISQSKNYLSLDQAIIIISEKGKEKFAIEKLQSFGFSNIVGGLFGGFDTWLIAKQKIDIVVSITAEELLLELKYGKLEIYDLRKSTVFNKQHLDKSENTTISSMMKNAENIDNHNLTCIICEDGVVSMTLISYLKTHSKHNIYHLTAGFKSILENDDFELVSLKNVKV